MTRSHEWIRPRCAAPWWSQHLRRGAASAILCAAVFVGNAPSVVWAAGVVGTGTAASCTDAALNTALSGGGLVTFNCGSAPVTIDISTGAGGNGTKTISADTTIDGGSLITISGGNSVGVFSVDADVAFAVQNLTIANGYNASGGAIWNLGALTATNSTFSGNSAADYGGAIYNNGTLTVTNSTFSGNSAVELSGGAITNAGTMNVANSTFSNNSAHSVGGGIVSWGSLTVSDGTFSGNSGGGAIYNEGGALTVTNSSFSGNSSGAIDSVSDGTLTVTNSSFSGNSGGIQNLQGTLTVIDSTFSGNSAVAIYNGGTLTVTNNTFSDNSAAAIDNSGALTVTDSSFSGNSGGAIHNSHALTVTNSTFSGNNADRGGGILSWGSLTVTNSSFSGNRATNGGAIYNGGTLTVTFSTFSGNSAATTNGAGGAIFNDSGTLTLTNSTFFGNSATNGGAVANAPYGVGGTLTVTNSTFAGNSAANGGGGAVYAALCGGNAPCAATLTNTIVAGSAQGGNCAGTITDGGHNLDDGTSCGFGTANGSLSSTDPKLDPAGLADNDALTQTIALLAGSPGMNKGDPTVCADPPVYGVDQRGYVRPGTGFTNCSIGAYEYNSPGPPAGCVGNCDASDEVTVDELVRLVNIALGNADMSECDAGDANGDGQITVDELIRAVNFALGGCADTGPGPLAPAVTIDTYPAVDGSTSTLPLARLIACELLGLSYRWEPGRGSEGEAEIVPVATTPKDAERAAQVLTRIVFSKTHQAYLNLVDGVVDLITVANPPSPEERAYADAHGVTLMWEPLALDALVIVLNESNAIRGLTTEQVQRIYMGELTNWSAVGGAASKINPYVRPENSGSQQLFNTIVMQGHPMAAWPPDRQAMGMGGLIDMIRADPLAIGYSVYYWVTYQYPKSGYSVIAVDGIAPTAQTIGTRSYPFTAEVWIVTRADLAEGSLARQLHDWLLSPDGQKAVGRSGYVPIVR